MKKEQIAGYVYIAFAEETRPVPLTKEVMQTLTNYFKLINGVYYYDHRKSERFIMGACKKK